MKIGSAVPDLHNRPAPLNFLPGNLYDGLRAANSIADVWGVNKITLRKEFLDAHRKKAAWVKHIAQHRNQPTDIAADILNSDETKWGEHVRTFYASTTATEEAYRQADHLVKPALETAAAQEFNAWETYADIHRQLPVEEVTAEFIAAARTLGADAWNPDSGKRHLDATYKLHSSGRKLQHLLYVANGIRGGHVPYNRRRPLALVAHYDDLPELKWDRPAPSGQYGLSSVAYPFRAFHTKEDEARHDALHEANRYADYVGDMLTRIALEEFDGITLDLTADHAEYQRRAEQVTRISRRTGHTTSGTGIPFRDPIDQIENPNG